MNGNGIKRFIAEAENYDTNPAVQKETLKILVTGEILKVMQEKNIKKAELAKRLRTTPANVTQMLNGNRNLTLDTLYDIACALGSKVNVSFSDEYSYTGCKQIEFHTLYEGPGQTDNDGVIAGECNQFFA